MKALIDPELIIDRSRIVEVDDYRVIIKEEREKSKTKLKAAPIDDLVPDFVNPFRQPDFAPDNQSSSEVSSE